MLTKYRKIIKTIMLAGDVLALLIMCVPMVCIALASEWLVPRTSWVVHGIILVIAAGVAVFGTLLLPAYVIGKMHEILFAWQDKKIYKQLQEIREAGILSVPAIIHTGDLEEHDCSEYFLQT